MGIEQSSNCFKQASDLIGKIPKQDKPKIKRVFHKSNVFNDNPFVCCEHMCGESYREHFVVEVKGQIIDSKLKILVSCEDYLEKAYINYQDLRMS